MRSFGFLLIIFFFQCKALSFNNPSDLNTNAFLETQLLRCMIEDRDCWEIPQDNQGVKQWTRLLGQAGGYETWSQSNIAERNGFVYSSGTTTGSLLNQPRVSPTTDYNDVFVAKYDRDGNINFIKQMGSTAISNTYAEVIHLDAFGDLYAVGSSNSPFNELPAVGAGSLLIKLNSSGNVIWTRIFPTGSETLGSGVTTDPEGNVYITGNTEESTINGETSGGGRKIFVFKYGRNGEFIWSRLIGGTNFEAYGQQIQYDPYSKNILVTGTVTGVGVFLGNTLPGGLTDSFILSLNTNNGAVKWVSYLGVSGGTVVTTLRALSVDKKGSVYLVGDVNGNIDNQTKDGATVQILVKYSVEGEKIWTRLLGGGGTSLTNGSQVFADNAFHIYVTGYTTGNVGGLTRIGVQDAYLSKYDHMGNLVWIRTSGSIGSTLYGRGISSDRYGTLYFSGATSGGFDDQTKQGTYDSFLIQYK
ncbi:hypothetical protein EHQ94_16555 [Leptospira meyeri]|nr:hypothetical protein EHQ94_16555 [Leptospira meyeri]TGM67319.1 hypothetical protein EHQ93_04795 [Leptospira meyeri]